MKLLRLKDLKELGVAQSWTQINRLIAQSGFPVGRRLNERSRVWTEAEVNAWMESLPSVDERPAPPLRGAAAANAAREAA